MSVRQHPNLNQGYLHTIQFFDLGHEIECKFRFSSIDNTSPMQTAKPIWWEEPYFPIQKNLHLFDQKKKPTPRPPNFLDFPICSHATQGIFLPPPSFPHRNSRMTFSISLITLLGALKIDIWKTGMALIAALSNVRRPLSDKKLES